MPVLQSQAMADKAMTLELAALQSANVTAQASPPTSTSAAPVQIASSVPVAEEPDFAEPQSPWVHAPDPAPPAESAAPIAPAAHSSQPVPQPQYPWMPAPSPAPVAQVSQPAGPPQNPWAALASQKAAPPTNAPEPQSQNSWVRLQSQQAARPSAPAVAPLIQAAYQATPAATHSAAAGGQPAAGSTAPSEVAAAPPAASWPVQRQCFTNSDGVKICYTEDQQRHNTTDVHKEGGINDYHNQASAHEKQGIQGHVPGNNVTDTLNHLGQNPPPNEQKDGNTAFQGQSEADVQHQHDIHKDNSTFTDHESTSGNTDQDWKSAHRGPDGSKDMAEISQDGQLTDESGTKVDAQGKDEVDVQKWRGSTDHRFLSDKPGTANDSALVWDEDWTRKDQKAEFQGPGVYDLHEESDARSTVHAKVDGDQGWTQFEQDMDDFGTLFDDAAAWRAKMRDTRVEGPAARLLKRRDGPDSDSDERHDDDNPNVHLSAETAERWYYPRIERYARNWRDAWVREARGLVIVVPEFHQAVAEYLELAKEEDPLPQPFHDDVPPTLEQIVSWYIQQHKPEMVVVQDVGMDGEKMDVTPVTFHDKNDVVVEPKGVEGGPRFKFGWFPIHWPWGHRHHHDDDDDDDEDDDYDDDDDDGKKFKRQISTDSSDYTKIDKHSLAYALARARCLPVESEMSCLCRMGLYRGFGCGLAPMDIQGVDGIAKRAIDTGESNTEALLADAAAEGKTVTFQPRWAPAPEKCVADETQWHCACRLGTAPSYPCAVIFGHARPEIGQNERFKPEDAGALVRRGEARKQVDEFWEYFQQHYERYGVDNNKKVEHEEEEGHDEEWIDSQRMAFVRDVDAGRDSADLVAASTDMSGGLHSKTTAGAEHSQSSAEFHVDAMSSTVLGLTLVLLVVVFIQMLKRMRRTPEDKRKEWEDYEARLRELGIEPSVRSEQGKKWG